MMNTNVILTKMICFFLSVLMAFLIVFSVFGAFTVGMLKSQNYISGKLEQHDEQLLSEINKKLSDDCTDMSLPKEAFTNALSKGEVDSVIGDMVSDMILCYEIDFSDSEKLYGYFTDGITDYCEKNNIDAMSEDISRGASLAVDITNEALAGSSTGIIKLFQKIQGSRLILLAVLCAAFAVACAVAIDSINSGRHRKFSYIGMGLATSGVMLTAATVFVKHMGYIDNYEFCSFELYNNAITDAVNATFKPYPIIGICLAAAGFIMLILNYIYFAKKNKMVQEKVDMNIRMKDEYIQHFNEKKGNTKVTSTDEKEVSKIEFD